MRKILFVSVMSGSPWGGSEELWCAAAMALLKQGHTVGVNFPLWPNPVRQLRELEAAGAVMQWRDDAPKPRPAPPTPRRSLPVRVIRRIVRELRPAPKPPMHPPVVEAALRGFAPDLVVISQGHFTEGWVWMNTCRALCIPFCPLAQCVGEWLWPDDAGAYGLRDAFENARRNYWISAANLESAKWQMATCLPNAKVIPQAFSVRRDAHPAWPEGDELRLACIGRLHGGIKGHDILFDVLRSEKWKARALKVVIFGSGPISKSMAIWKDMYKVDNVEFGGYSDDIESTWANHHGLIHTSRVEGLPLVIIEAMLCNRLCIVTDIAGNAELIEDNETGFVAVAPNARMVDEALERAWARRHEWKAIGEAAGRRIREQIPASPGQVLADDLLSLLEAKCVQNA